MEARFRNLGRMNFLAADQMVFLNLFMQSVLAVNTDLDMANDMNQVWSEE